MRLIGKVNNYNPSRHTGYICNLANGLTCMFKDSDVEDGDVSYGYIVEYYLEFDEELRRKCAKGIRVIDSSRGIYKEKKIQKKKRDNNQHKKGCNADKVAKK